MREDAEAQLPCAHASWPALSRARHLRGNNQPNRSAANPKLASDPIDAPFFSSKLPDILLDNCRIGPQTIIGAGSVVPAGREIPSGVLAFGSPARVVRDLTEDDIAWIDYSWRSYVERAARFAERDRGAPA